MALLDITEYFLQNFLFSYTRRNHASYTSVNFGILQQTCCVLRKKVLASY